jgi:hypothetical protein
MYNKKSEDIIIPDTRYSVDIPTVDIPILNIPIVNIPTANRSINSCAYWMDGRHESSLALRINYRWLV